MPFDEMVVEEEDRGALVLVGTGSMLMRRLPRALMLPIAVLGR